MSNEQANYSTQDLESLQADVALGDALDRLVKNRDFKKLILDMYLKDGADMLTRNYWKIKHRENGKLEFIQDGINARSMLYGFMEDVQTNAMGARAEFSALNKEESEGE